MSTGPRITSHLTREQACLKLIALLSTPVLNQPDTPKRDVASWLVYALGKITTLSSGEQFMVHVVHAVWNGDRTAPIAGLRDIDRGLRLSVLAILTEALGAD